MGRAILLCGKDATNPYCFEGLRLQVYTAEELCYVLKENAFLLDKSIVDKRLIEWLDEECGLNELAKELCRLLDRSVSLSDFVMTILEYVRLYEEPTLQKARELLRQGENLSSYEKEKSRIDILVQQGKYVQALKEYDVLLKELPEVENLLSAQVLHNKGVAYVGMFQFSRAVQCFYSSFEMYPFQETYLSYLAAKRMQLTDQEYVDFVSKQPEAYEDSMELEKRVEALRRTWQERERELQPDKYQLIQELKQQYRRNCGEFQ